LDKLKKYFSTLSSQGLPDISQYLPFGNKLGSHNWIGLEINSDYVKFLKIHTNEHHQIEYFGMLPLKEGMVVKNEITDYAGIATIIKDHFRKQGITTKNIVVSVNYSTIITKTLTVNKHLNSDEIEMRVWSEANNLFPNMINEIYLDYVVAGVSPQDDTQLEIFVVACRRVNIKPYLEIMRLADLDLKAIDVNCYALERSLSLIRRQFPNKTLALLNVGFSLITLIIVHEENLNYTHELLYDGHKLMQQIQQNDAKSETGEMLRKNLSLHLKHSLQFFYTSRPHIRIEQIILSGDCAALIPNLAEFIQEETGKETVISNPFQDMKLAPYLDNASKDEISLYAPAFMQCCGLALYQLH